MSAAPRPALAPMTTWPCARARPVTTKDPTMRQAVSLQMLLLTLVLLLAGTAAHAAAPVYKTRTNIDTVPTGAQMYLVEGSIETFQGVTPMKLFKLPRGTIQLKFKKDGFDDLVQTVTIATSIQTLLFNMARTIQAATIELTCGAEFAGGMAEIDGKAMGPIPSTTKVSPGRHQVVVTKDGYQRWERWIEATEGQRATFDVVLTKVEAQKGEILVTSSPSGATVTVNGAPRGVTPTVVEALSAGPYLVEVALADYVKASQTVNVEPGKRAIFDAPLVKAKGDTGELKILADIEDATVYLDGEAIGKAPVTQAGVRIGTHQIEARSPRGFYAEATVEVKAGELFVVRLKMVQTAPPDKGTVRVVTTAPEGEGKLDDSEWKPLPTVFNEVDVGSHIVRVRAAGFAPWSKTITVERGQSQEVVAELGQAGRVEVATKDGRQADLFLDGKPLGKTPFIGDVPAGTHTLLVQRDDGKQEEFQIAVSTERVVKVNAAFGSDIPKVVVQHRPLPFSARALSGGTGHASAIVSWPKWPFPLFLQAGGGIGNGMDMNVQFRTAFDVINELELMFKWCFVDTKTLATSVELGIGGGLGANDRSSFVLRPVLKGSLLIGEKAAITARAGFLYHTDRLGPETDERTRDRDAGIRFYLGLNVEFEITSSMNLTFMLEGDPVGDGRRLYEESFLDDPDPKLYFAGGLTFIF